MKLVPHQTIIVPAEPGWRALVELFEVDGETMRPIDIEVGFVVIAWRIKSFEPENPDHQPFSSVYAITTAGEADCWGFVRPDGTVESYEETFGSIEEARAAFLADIATGCVHSATSAPETAGKGLRPTK